MNDKTEQSLADALRAMATSNSDLYESLTGPISIGYYEDTDEVFIECEGQRVQLPAEHFNTIIKQLRRANRLALKAKGEPS